MPYILIYSALHIMQWFSHILDVFTPKIRRKFLDFYILWIKTNVAYTRLEVIARTRYCTTTTASNWFVTLYYKLLPAVRSSSKHGRRRSSLLLYSVSMGISHACYNLHIQIPPDRLCGSHITQYRYGYYKSEYRWGYYEGTLQLLHAQ